MSLLARRRALMRSSGGGFVPTDISGCVLWADTSDASTIVHEVYSSADRYRSISDKSGNSNDFNQGIFIGPEYGPEMIFDPSFLGLTAGDTLSYQDNYHILAVVSDATNRFKIINKSDPYWRFYVNSSGFLSFYNVATNYASAFTATGAGLKLVEASINTSGSLLSLNGLDSAFSYTSNNATGAADVILGNNATGSIYEILFYSTNLTGDNKIKVRNYLNSKWNIY